jgi:hypothetical protein
MNDTLLIILGILLVVDLGLDLTRLWSQSTVEAKLTDIENKLEALRVDLNGKAKQVLDLAIATADQIGYKRARDEQVALDLDKNVIKTVTTETTKTVKE